MKKVLWNTFLSILLCYATCQQISAQAGNSILKEYKGSPFKTMKIPGTVEAENYDNGGAGVAYNFKNGTAGNAKDYRDDKGVSLNRHGNRIAIGHVSSGDWLNYTIDVEKDGVYAFDTYCVTGGANGRFYFELDGQPLFKVQDAPEGNWNDFSQTNRVEEIVLKAGRHLLTWRTFGGMNFDKVVITRTGDITGKEPKPGEFNYKYPLTAKEEQNPLFVNLPSQMYESPFIGNLYTADPSAHVWKINGKERLYLYASHDMEPTKGCDHMDRYHIFSTDDLVNWTDHGEFLNADDVNKQLGTKGPGFMWAPDCAYNPTDKNYYFYFPKKVVEPVDGKEKGVWHIFVATSKSPEAGFKLKGYVKGIPSTIDPCVFVDDNGQPYIYTSGAGKGGWGGKLNKNDWTKLDGEMTPMQGFVDFHEAPWVFKRNGIYYMTNSDNHRTNLGGNRLVYSMSNSPLGPWKQYGVYMYPHGEETAHGSIVEFKGKWYAFYHTANYSGAGALRSVCFDPVEFDADGHIQVVRNWGTPKKGKAPEISLAKVTHIEAEDYNEGGSHYAYFKRPGNEMKVETNNGNTYIANMKRKEWVRYTVSVKEAGRYAFACKMLPVSGGSKFYLGIDGVWTSPNPNELKGQNGQWTIDEVKNVELEPGEHYIEWRSMSGCTHLDWITVSASTNKIPGVIEVEDYDDNGYSFKNASMGNAKSYRKDKGVALNSDKDVRTGKQVIHLCNASGGDWLNYTFEAEAGTYDVTVYAATAAKGRYSLSFDNNALRFSEVEVSTGNWNNYEPFVQKGVQMTGGKHTLTLHLHTAINIDKIVFQK